MCIFSLLDACCKLIIASGGEMFQEIQTLVNSALAISRDI